MTTKYVQPGDLIDYVAPAPVNSNDVIVAGALIGVAVADIAQGETGTLAIEGVFDLAHAGGAAVAVGAPLAWSVADQGFTGAAGVAGDVVGGAVAVAAAAAGDPAIRVKLVPGGGKVIA